MAQLSDAELKLVFFDPMKVVSISDSIELLLGFTAKDFYTVT